jgi:hypothetical protein
MTTGTLQQTARTADHAAFARVLSLVAAGGVVAASGVAWGMAGVRAAGVGAALSVLNTFLLTRLARQAIAASTNGGDPTDALNRLNVGLLFKTIGLLGAVWFLSRLLRLETLPLALGLLVNAFSLVAAGFVIARQPE